jgi:hypothetical protein
MEITSVISGPRHTRTKKTSSGGAYAHSTIAITVFDEAEGVPSVYTNPLSG